MATGLATKTLQEEILNRALGSGSAKSGTEKKDGAKPAGAEDA